MQTPYLELALLVVLTAINALFTGSEIAFISLREGQLQRLEETERGRRIVRLARNPNQFLATCQIGVTLAGLFAASTAAISLTRPIEKELNFLGSAANTVSVLLVTVALAYVTLVIGELAPKRIAMQRAESWVMAMGGILRAVAEISRPVIWLLDQSTNVIVRIIGGDPSIQREQVTEEEIRDLLESQENVTDDQRSIIAGAFEIGERTLREVVVPRGSVISIPATMAAQDTARVLAEEGHSRAPVHTGDLDDVLGIVHIRDLINATGPTGDQARPATVVPESLGVLDALRRLQTSRQQMAIVVNEHGGVEGIVTVEDLLEEIVGEIYDEFDQEIAKVERGDDGSAVLPGSFPIHNLPDINIELPDGEGSYATVAGYVLDCLGHIPVAGEVAHGEHWDIEVLEVEDRAITQVRLIPISEANEQS